MSDVKSKWYQSQDVVDIYERRRFGGRSGQYVNEREMTPYLEFIRERVDGRILDMPVGTGRLAKEILKLGGVVEGADLSDEMLKFTEQCCSIRLHKCDARDTGFSDDSFQCVVSMRFFQHFQQLQPFLVEMKRIVQPGGYLLFDVFGWSPRSLLRSKMKRTYSHSRSEVLRVIAELGLRELQVESQFLMPPLVIRHLPLWAARLMASAEQIVPAELLTRHFFMVEKPA